MISQQAEGFSTIFWGEKKKKRDWRLFLKELGRDFPLDCSAMGLDQLIFGTMEELRFIVGVGPKLLRYLLLLMMKRKKMVVVIVSRVLDFSSV